MVSCLEQVGVALKHKNVTRPHKKLLTSLNKCIDPDYYGYRDEDDGAPPPLLRPRSAVASLLAMPGA